MGGLSIMGTGLAYDASKRATAAQVKSANQANQTQLQALNQQNKLFEDQMQLTREGQNNQLGLYKSMYDQTRSDLSPYVNAGNSALGALSSYWGFPSPNTSTGGGMMGMPTAGGGMPGQPMYGQGGFGPTQGSANNAFDMLKRYPGYQFQFDQGLEALNRNLSAGGRYQSGAMMKDAQIFGQGQAENSVNNYLAMLQYIGGLGQAGAAGQAANNSGLATGSSNAITNAMSGMNNLTGNQASMIGNYGQNIAQTQLSSGTARAAGITGAANQMTGGIENLLGLLMSRPMSAFSGYSQPTGYGTYGNNLSGGYSGYLTGR